MPAITIPIKGDNSDLINKAKEASKALGKLMTGASDDVDDIMQKFKNLAAALQQGLGKDAIAQLTQELQNSKTAVAEAEAHIQDLNEELEKTGDSEKREELIAQINREDEAVAETLTTIATYNQLIKILEGNEEEAANGFREVAESAKQAAQAQQTIGDSAGNSMSILTNETAKAVKEEFNLKSIINQLPTPLRIASKALFGVAAAGKALIAIPLIAFLAAVSAAFAAVQKWMTSSAKGQEAYVKSTAKLEALSISLGNAFVKVGESIYNAFDKAKKVMEGTGGALEAIIKLIPGLGTLVTVVDGLDKLDVLDKLDELTDDMKENLPDAYKSAKSISEVVEKVNMTKLNLNIEKGEWDKAKAQLETDIAELQNEIAEGVDPGQKLKAVSSALDKINEKYNKEIELAKKEYEANVASSALSEDTKEETAELLRQEAEIMRMEAQRGSEQKKLLKMRASLEKQIDKDAIARARELAKLNLDIQAEYIKAKNDGLQKSIQLIKIERQKQLQSLADQKTAWENNQKRKVNVGGTEVEESYITPEQTKYLADKRKQIEATTAADIKKTTKDYYDDIYKELIKLNADYEKEKVEAQSDSLQKSLEIIRLEAQSKRDALEEQRKTWMHAQGKLEDAQQEYLDKQKMWIDESEEKKQQDALVKTYETTSNKFKELYKQYQGDMMLLLDEEQQKVATEQLNKNAISLVQGDSDLARNFESFKQSLEDKTLASISTMIQEMESQLNSLQDQSSVEALALRANIEAAKDKALEMQKALQNKKPADVISNLNNNLKQCATNLSNLGQEAQGEFGEVAKVMADIIDTTSTLIDSYQQVAEGVKKLGDMMISKTLETADKIETGIKSGIDGVVTAERAGVAAIKSMETASVILAIIGAVMQAVQAIVKMTKGSHDYLGEIKEDARQTNKELEKTLASLDLTRNKISSMFGDDPWSSFIESTKDATKYLDEFYQNIDDRLNDNMFQVFNKGYGPKFSEVLDMVMPGASQFDKAISYIEHLDVQTKHSTWFRSEKRDTLKNLGYDIAQYKDGVLDIEATMEALTNFKNTSKQFDHLKAADQDMIDSMIADWQTYQDAVQQTTDAMKTWFGGLTTSFGDAMVEAFETGEDAADKFKENVGDSIRSMVKDMLISQYITKYFDDAAESITKMEQSEEWARMSSQDQGKAIADKIMDASDKALQQLDAVSSAYGKVDEYLNEKGYLSSAERDASGTLSGAIAGASQESIDLLSGYCNAVRIQQVESIDLLREQLVSLSGIETNTAAMVSICRGIRDTLQGQTTDAESLRANGL